MLRGRIQIIDRSLCFLPTTFDLMFTFCDRKVLHDLPWTHDTAYVIGGIVDRNRLKNATLNKVFTRIRRRRRQLTRRANFCNGNRSPICRHSQASNRCPVRCGGTAKHETVECVIGNGYSLVMITAHAFTH